MFVVCVCVCVASVRQYLNLVVRLCLHVAGVTENIIVAAHLNVLIALFRPEVKSEMHEVTVYFFSSSKCE